MKIAAELDEGYLELEWRRLQLLAGYSILIFFVVGALAPRKPTVCVYLWVTVGLTKCVHLSVCLHVFILEHDKQYLSPRQNTSFIGINKANVSVYSPRLHKNEK